LTQANKTPANGVNEHEQGTENHRLPKLQVRYSRRHREGKSRMLDETCEDYEYERKQAIKVLCGGLPPSAGGAIPDRSHGMR